MTKTTKKRRSDGKFAPHDAMRGQTNAAALGVDQKPGDAQGPEPTFADITVQTDLTRVVMSMSMIAGFCGSVGNLRSPIEIGVGSVIVVVCDGQIEGVRMGPHSQVEHFEPLELMEMGAFLYAVGTKLRHKQVSEHGDALGVVHALQDAPL